MGAKSKNTENGNKISEYKLAAIRADYLAGIGTQSSIAQKHRISRTTLIRNAKRFDWKWGECNINVTEQIQETASRKLVETETNKLINYTTRHLKQIKNIKTLSVINAATLAKIAETDRVLDEVTQTEANRLWTIQKFLKLNAETHDLCYKSERLAMGIQDSDTPPIVNINIGKGQDLKKLTQNELDIMLGELTEVN